MIELQGFIRIFFASDHLTDAAQAKLLETEGVSGDISIEGSAVQQTHNHSVWDTVLKQVGNVKAGQGAYHVEGAYLASYRGVLGQLSVPVSFGVNVPEHLFIQTELTQVKLDLDVRLQQTSC